MGRPAPMSIEQHEPSTECRRRLSLTEPVVHTFCPTTVTHGAAAKDMAAAAAPGETGEATEKERADRNTTGAADARFASTATLGNSETAHSRAANVTTTVTATAATSTAPKRPSVPYSGGERHLLADGLWSPTAATTISVGAIDVSLFLRCLEAPEHVSVHFKDEVQPLLSHLQCPQPQQQPHQDLLLRVEGVVTRQQSLGRRLCFFDIMPQHAVAAAAAAAAAAAERTAKTTPSAGTVAAPNLKAGATLETASRSITAARSGATGTAASPVAMPATAQGTAPAAAINCIALCCSVSSSDLCGVDVHRSILRKMKAGDNVEALGLLEVKCDTQALKQYRQRLREAETTEAFEATMMEVMRVIGFKVLALRACRAADAAAAAAAEAAAKKAAATALEKAQRSHVLQGEPRAAVSFPVAATEPAVAAGSAPSAAEGKLAAVAAELSRVCKVYLLTGSCKRFECPLLHTRDGVLRRQFDILKAQRQVRRVQQHLEQQQQGKQQHQQMLLRPLAVSSREKPPGAAFSASALQSLPQQQQTVQLLQLQQHQRIYPRSLRAAVFVEWLVSTYGIDRLRQGTGVVEVAGGRGEVAFELSLKYKIPTTVIDPRCTYTPKSDEAQTPEIRRQWEQAQHALWRKAAPGYRVESLLGNSSPSPTTISDGLGMGATGEQSISRKLPAEGLPSWVEGEGDCCSSVPERAAVCSAMAGGSRRSLLCPLRLNRRQKQWLQQQEGLRGKAAETAFAESVETIPAVFNEELIRRSPYVRDKVLNAAAIVGLHPDEAAGDIVQTGLLVHDLRMSNKCMGSGTDSSDDSTGSASSGGSAGSSEERNCRHSGGDDRSKDCNRSSACEDDSPDSVQAQHRRSTARQKWLQQEEAGAERRGLVLAVVPCCVFSEKFPCRRVPAAAAEAAAKFPAAAAAAAAAVPAVFPDAVEPSASAVTASAGTLDTSCVATTSGAGDNATASSAAVCAKGCAPADCPTAVQNLARAIPGCTSVSYVTDREDRLLQEHSFVPASSPRKPVGSESRVGPVGPTCVGAHLGVGTASISGHPDGSLVRSGSELDGTVCVRTYEELLLWLHLLDPRRRLQQQTLPLVGKNQVLFLPP